MLVLPLPFGSQAKPKRGAQSFLSGKLAPFGASLSPGNTSPGGALGKRVDCRPGMTEKERPWVSSFGVLYSYRTPKLSTRFFKTCHSSCAKKLVFLLRIFDGAWPNCVYMSGAPKRKSARSF